MTRHCHSNVASDKKKSIVCLSTITKAPKSSLFSFARFLPLPWRMGNSGKSAESLIEILSLCAQTLAAFDAANGTNDPLPLPVKTHARRPNAKYVRRFALIKGGLQPQDSGPKAC